MSLAIMFAVLLHVSLDLPSGFEGANWGISPAQLQQQVTVYKAGLGSGYSYADHLEVEPDVYVRTTSDNKKIEYYFFKGKLYKIYVIYDRAKSDMPFYKQLIAGKQKTFGPAAAHFQEKVFGLLVLHVRWDDGVSILDLRSGAGYVYEVMVDKSAELEKARLQQNKRAI